MASRETSGTCPDRPELKGKYLRGFFFWSEQDIHVNLMWQDDRLPLRFRGTGMPAGIKERELEQPDQKFNVDIHKSLCFALYSTSRYMTQLYRHYLKEMDVTYPQFLVLVLLWQNTELSVQELGQQLSLDSGTLTPLLKRLESKNILTRDRCPADERKVLIRLTEKGRMLEGNALAMPEALLCDMNIGLEELFPLVDKINNVKSSLKKSLTRLHE